MKKTSRWVAVLTAAALGLSVSAFAAGGGGGGGGGGGSGGGGGNGGGRGGDHGSGGHSEQHRSADDAKAKAEQHKSGTETDATKGKRTAADQLGAHPQLADRLSKLSGLSATDLKTAAADFKNFGQFVAAVHVSKNLDIPFDKLKAEMTKDGGSLGKAIKTLSPKSNADAEENKANRQAQQDLKQAS